MVEKKKLEEKDKSDARKSAEKEIKAAAKAADGEERKKALDGQKKILSGEKAKKKGFGVSDKSISETKYGCLVAFNVEECKQLGFGKDAKTKEVSTHIKKKLGITK